MERNTLVKVTIPIKIESVANLRETWRSRAKRSQTHRRTAKIMLWQIAKTPCISGKVIVKITRVAPRELDCDNLIAGAKACRDGIADWLGVPDNDPRIEWKYAQEKGKPKEYAASIDIEWIES